MERVAVPDADPVEALSPFAEARCERIVLAVSGGGDSTALLVAAAARLDPSSLLAVTVDHGLRPEAAEEARGVAALCERLRVEHRIVRLDGPPRTGLMAWARAARLETLVDAAGASGIVLLGHTRDDVAETVAMRAARGPGLGLAGIAPATLVGRKWLYRPLIGHARADLRDWLRARGHGWHDDPANLDPRFERARLRHELDPGARREALAVAARWRERRERESALAARAVAGRVARRNGAIEVSGWPSVARARHTVLRALLPLVGRHSYPPSGPAIAAALDALDQGKRFTLGGCLVARRGNALHVESEARAVPRATAQRIVPSFDWPLHRAIVPDAPDPPVPLVG